ncbi:zinc finger MYM-type protein 1-like [Aphis gossypii]|uniref:zinc finger MYM-type protein 1-like n=1 Tax=Aphis gossypii TaxID=80765 RepID=UPI0021596C6F|nr:zinc finger MYM-type protein 1-like [Aphis gossypii]
MQWSRPTPDAVTEVHDTPSKYEEFLVNKDIGTSIDNSVEIADTDEIACTHDVDDNISLGKSFPNDPSRIPDHVSYTLLHHFVEMGPCQPYPHDLENGSNDWKNLKRTIESHECSSNHLQSEISRGLYTKNIRLDTNLLHTANKEVESNREILRVVIEALIFIAQQNIAIRGHNEKITSLNTGNFLELLKLLSNYHPVLNTHLDKIKNTSTANRLTFMSNKSQNKILKILGDLVLSTILKNIKQAGIFAVIIDTTTDVSNLEQFSFILRFINEKGVTEERLVALETVDDSTGQGLFKCFKKITEEYAINWREHLCAQSYDGAACMQGVYSGLRSLIQIENPKAIYIWCFAHQLNLVVIDTCDCCEDTRNFFGEVQSLVTYLRARKRTSTFVKIQKELYPKERVLRLRNFSDTRWTSHDRVIDVIYTKFKALLQTLYELKNSTDRTTASMAKTLKLVDLCKDKLKSLRSEKEYISIFQEAKSYANIYNLPNNDFKPVRAMKRKKMADENVQDEVSDSPFERYRINTFFKVIDQIIRSIESRFSDAREILKDLALLSPERLMQVSKEKDYLPEDSFKYIADWLNYK